LRSVRTMTVRVAFLDAADSALTLLRDPAVGARWDETSALTEFSVAGLAAHLAHQTLTVPRVLRTEAPDDPPVPLLGHYERVSWIGADLDTEANTGIRRHAEQLAAGGAEELVTQVAVAIDQCRADLANEPADRVVRTPSGPWSLSLDDFLVTRMMEIAVHSDDLAVSVGVPTPDLPESVLAPVLSLLTGLAVRRHGQAALLRALTRAERAPDRINAL